MKRFFLLCASVVICPVLLAQSLMVLFTTNRMAGATGGSCITNKTICVGSLYLQYGTNRILYFTNEMICHVTVTKGSNQVATWFEQVPHPGNRDRLRYLIQQLNRLETNR